MHALSAPKRWASKAVLLALGNAATSTTVVRFSRLNGKPALISNQPKVPASKGCTSNLITVNSISRPPLRQLSHGCAGASGGLTNTAPMVNKATGAAAAASNPTVLFNRSGNTQALAENTAPSPMPQVSGILNTLLMAFKPALRTPCTSAWSNLDMAIHTELVKNTSTNMVTMAVPTAAGPNKFSSSGKPM